MSDVNITINAKDRVSQTLDALSKKIDKLNNNMKETQQVSVGAGDKMSGSFINANQAISLVGDGMQKVGSKLTNYITKPVLAAGTALAGFTLAKGFARMQEIDNARVKIQAMGKDFDAIKEAANNAVTDTAFSLSEAMTAGASAAAAGVKEAEMGDYLQTVANHAAVAGVSFDEMGTVFNKVMANGKLQAEEWNMMTDRGIDMFGAFRKVTGKSNEEIIEMRKNGELTSDVFMEAMRNAYDDANIAQTIGSGTIAGAARNVVATLSRIGAALLGDTENGETFAGKLLPLLNSLKDAMKKLIPVAEDLGKKFSEMIGPSVEKLTDFFEGFASGDKEIDKTQLKLAGVAGIATTLLGPALMIVGKALAAFGSGGGIGALTAAFPGLASAIGAVAGPIAAVVALLAAVWVNSANFRKSLMNLFATLGESIMKVVTAMAPVVAAMFEILGPVFGWLGDLLAPVVDALAAAISFAADKVAEFATNITPYMQLAGAIAQDAAAKISAMGGAWKAIKSTTKRLLTKVSEKAAAILEAIKKAWDAIKSAVKSLTVNVLGGASGALSGIKSAWDSIVNGATKTLNVITNKSTKNTGGGSSWGGGGQGGSGHPHQATGTRSAGGGTTLVGERGPELVNLPKGASVHTARDTEKMFGGNNISITINPTIANEGMSVDQVISQLTDKLSEAVDACCEGAS